MSPTSATPRAATGPGSLLRAELGRLRHRRLVLALVLLSAIALLGATAIVFATHDRDVAGARAEAQVVFEQSVADQIEYSRQCRADPNVPDKEMNCPSEQIDPSQTVASFYRDPRLRADQGLPGFALGVGVGGALLMGLVGATAVGADWSSRAIVTLLTWQPRRLRFLATRLGAIAVAGAVLGVVGQLLGLALGALTVATRGTFAPSPAVDGGFASGGPGLVAAAHFWRDLVSLQGRGVLLMILAGVAAASIAMITRSTGGFLGVALGWFVIVEVAGQGLLASRAPALAQWTLTQNVTALLTPGGATIYAGDQMTNGNFTPREIHVSNLDALWHLGLLAAVVALMAAVLLRRRDL